MIRKRRKKKNQTKAYSFNIIIDIYISDNVKSKKTYERPRS